MTHKKLQHESADHPNILNAQAILIYTNAYRDGYLEAMRDTVHLMIKQMLDHEFDDSSVQRALGVTLDEIQEVRGLYGNF